MSYIRKEFEEMIRVIWGNTYSFMKDTDGHYCDDVLDGMWWMFQQNERAGQAVSVPERSELIDLLISTRNQSEGATADLILGLIWRGKQEGQ